MDLRGRVCEPMLAHGVGGGIVQNAGLDQLVHEHLFVLRMHVVVVGAEDQDSHEW